MNLTLPKFFLFLSNKIFPFLALPFLIVYWINIGGVPFAALTLGLPLLFGYIAPGIGTNILKMWRFRDSWTIGKYFMHHGFIYAATMGLAMVLAFVPPIDNSWPVLFGNIMRGAAILGFIGWTHDLIAIKEGQMEVYNEPWKRGAAPEVIAAQYAPLGFSLLGASYAGIVTLGYKIVVLDKNINSLWWWLPLGLILMTASISLPFISWIKEAIGSSAPTE